VSTDGVLPARYNFTALDGATCLRGDDFSRRRTVPVIDPFGSGTLAVPAAAGPPLQLPVAQGPITIAGVPVLSGKVTSAALDGRAFFGLATGTSPADARVVHNNLLPLRRALPVTDSEFAIELPGVVVEVPAGENLYLTVTPVSDLFFGHGSRTPGAMVLTDVELDLPVTSCTTRRAKDGRAPGKSKACS
jgi:ABC-2 type transport system ATP-binding protein